MSIYEQYKAQRKLWLDSLDKVTETHAAYNQAKEDSTKAYAKLGELANQLTPEDRDQAYQEQFGGS